MIIFVYLVEFHRKIQKNKKYKLWNKIELSVINPVDFRRKIAAILSPKFKQKKKNCKIIIEIIAYLMTYVVFLTVSYFSCKMIIHMGAKKKIKCT